MGEKERESPSVHWTSPILRNFMPTPDAHNVHRQELIALGYDMSRPCDRFERTPQTVAIRHDQGAALALVLRSLACLDIQRLARGFRGRQKAKRIKAAWSRGAKTDAPEKDSAIDVDEGGGDDWKADGDADGANESDLQGLRGEVEGNAGSAEDATNGEVV